MVCVGDPGINGLATVRSLGRRGVPVQVVSIQGSAQIASASRYCSHRMLRDARDLPGALLGMAQRAVLYVDNDPMMKLLEPHAAALAQRFEVVDAIAHAARLTDKALQMAAAREAGIAVPRTWFPSTWGELRAIGRDSTKRLIAKPSPSRYPGAARAAFKALIAGSASELDEQLRPLVASPRDVLVQEFIEGDDAQIYTGLCYRARSRDRCYVMSARKLRQTSPGAGIMAAGQAVDAPEVRCMTRRLAEQLGLQGVLATEFKLDPRDGRLYFIEWNPRPPYFQSIGWQSGFDLAWLAYCDRERPQWLGHEATAPNNRHYWINFGGELSHLIKAPRAALRPQTWLPYLCRKEWAVLAFDDLRPWIRSMSACAGWLTRALLRGGWARLRRAIPGTPAKERAPGQA